MSRYRFLVSLILVMLTKPIPETGLLHQIPTFEQMSIQQKHNTVENRTTFHAHHNSDHFSPELRAPPPSAANKWGYIWYYRILNP
jgi:hypothetical protein